MNETATKAAAPPPPNRQREPDTKQDQVTSQQAQPEKAPEANREIKPLSERRCALAHASNSSSFNIWAATVEAGTHPREVLVSAFWANCAARFRVGDEVRVIDDKSTWRALLFVHAVSSVGAGTVNNRVDMKMVSFFELGLPESHPDIGDHRIAHMGAHLKWCIIRIADQKVVRDGFDTQDEAEKARRGYSLAQSR